jgi:glycosyltransferase involved in cell wall biosynthesis/SAM-dependent methyltransferase
MVDTRRNGRFAVDVGWEEAHFHPYGGNGRVWQQLLDGLRADPRVRLNVARRSSRFGGRNRADAWLVSGHLRPRPLDEAVVSLVHEASWHDPDLRALLSPSFLEWIVPDTRAAIRASSRVVVPSECARQEVVADSGCDPEMVSVVPYGVDLDRFRPGLRGGREIVARARGGSDAPYLLYVGSAHPRKNLLGLREAFVRLCGRGLPHVLVLVATASNDWEQSAELLAAARAPIPGAPQRIVHIAGLDDPTLATLMADADALCLPSLWEGFGLPVLEAMACGTPVVVSNRGSLPEVAGEAGVVVEPDVDAIEEGLERLLGDAGLASAMGRAGRARAEEFPWSRTVAGTLGALELAATEHRDLSTALHRAWPGVRFVPVADCPMCGESTDRAADVVLGGRPALRRCRRCALVFAPQTGRAEDFYVDGYHADLGAHLHGPGLGGYLDELARHRVAFLEGSSGYRRDLLDVGCGAGELLEAARARGWQAHGVEPVSDTAAVARARGFTVACGTLGEIDVEPGAFDAVTATHVLEHVRRPVEFLEQLASYARPGGRVFVEVPNWQSALRMRNGASWWCLRPEQHISHFAPATMRTALRMAGLEPVTIATRTWLPRTLGLALAHLPGFARLNQWWMEPLSPRRRESGVVARVPGPVPWAMLQGAARCYDAAGLGSAVVAVARVP